MSLHIPTDLQWADLVSRVKNSGTAITVDSALSTTSENPVQNKVITVALNAKADSSSLATVATTGDYDDLNNLPTIPTATSDLTNDSNFVVSTDLAQVATSGSYNDLSNKPTIDNSIISGSTNAVSGGAVYTGLAAKADSSDVPTAVSELTNDSGYQTQAQVQAAVESAISSTYKAAGSVLFANLPQPSSNYEGYVYNIEDDFVTTADFVEGAGKSYPAGTNVAIVNVGTTQSPSYKYDVLGEFIDLSGYVQTTDYATTSTAGIISVGDGLVVTQSGSLSPNTFTTAEWNALWA